MHELSLARNIVAIVSDHAKDSPVARVRLAIGPLACVEWEALLFCFDLAAENTVLAGAALEFVDADKDTFLIKEFEMKEAA